MKHALKYMAASFVVVATLGMAPAQASKLNHMPTVGRTSQPIGHALFCRELPQECAVRSRSTRAPSLTKARWKELVAVNSHANTNVTPVTDIDYYGVEEHWTYPRNYGDCEDYVLLKRYMLMQRGWPASSLLITVVKQPNGEGHAVLTVRTDRADYVLDNLEGNVRKWSKTPYQFIKRQSVRHTGRWTGIRDQRRLLASR